MHQLNYFGHHRCVILSRYSGLTCTAYLCGSLPILFVIAFILFHKTLPHSLLFRLFRALFTFYFFHRALPYAFIFRPFRALIQFISKLFCFHTLIQLFTYSLIHLFTYLLIHSFYHPYSTPSLILEPGLFKVFVKSALLKTLCSKVCAILMASVGQATTHKLHIVHSSR